MKKLWEIVLLVLCIMLCFSGCGKVKEPMPTESEKAEINSVTGVVVEVSMHTLTVEDEGLGKTYTFLKDDTTQTDGKGELLGSTAEVIFVGEYSENMLAGEIRTVKTAETEKKETEQEPTAKETAAKAAEAEQKENAGKYMTGIILDATMNQITITARDGENYTFLKTEQTTAEAGAEQTEAVVRIEYSGEIGENPVAVKITKDSMDEKN